MTMFHFIKKKKRHVTLVLGGGSARGLAHIGVLRALEKEKIAVDRIVGTSMGALIGSAYALGMTTAEMQHKAAKFSVNKLLDPTLPKLGLLAGDRLEKIIRTLIDHKTFTDCKIPMVVVTTDIETGEEVIYQQGDMCKVIRASCSWPGIFNPVLLDGRLLSDGGIKNSVPTRIAKSLGSDYIIAVDVGFCVKKGKIDNIFQMILQSFQITGEELNKYQSKEADCLIKVELGHIDQVSFDRAEEAVTIGMSAALYRMDQLKKDLGIN